MEPLYDYQNEMKSRILHAWEGGYRSLLCQMPTGTGKTHLLTSLVAGLMQSGAPCRVLVVAHRIELIDQTSRKLRSAGIAHSVLAAGTLSGDTEAPVCVASIQTLFSASRREESARLHFDYLIIDEAHHSVAPLYRRLWESCPGSRILGLTATPCRMGRQGFSGLYDKLLLSQPVSKFIEWGRLSLFDYISVAPDSEAGRMVCSLRRRGADGDFSRSELSRLFNTGASVATLYQAYERYARGRKGIIYAIDRAHNEHIRSYFAARGVRIAAIDSRTPAALRADCVQRFRDGHLDVIVNVDIFSEGFDCPDLEFIQLARPTLSLSLYLQQVGRALRVRPQKEKAIIIDSVGLFYLFGLPDAPRDWNRHFTGELPARGNLRYLAESLSGIRASLAEGYARHCDMVLIKGCDAFRSAGFAPSVPRVFEANGLYGLRSGSDILLAPSYRHIGSFVGHYAPCLHTDGTWGILNSRGAEKPLPPCSGVEVYENSLARLELSSGGTLYADLRMDTYYHEKPLLFMEHFVPMLYADGRYVVRLPGGYSFDKADYSGLRSTGDYVAFVSRVRNYDFNRPTWYGSTCFDASSGRSYILSWQGFYVSSHEPSRAYQVYDVENDVLYLRQGTEYYKSVRYARPVKDRSGRRRALCLDIKNK